MTGFATSGVPVITDHGVGPIGVTCTPQKVFTPNASRYRACLQAIRGMNRVTKISDEARAVAAASLVQAHATILGGVYAGRRAGATVNVIPQELIERLFSHYLGVVEREPVTLRNELDQLENV
jgi:hypothetical protein